MTYAEQVLDAIRRIARELARLNDNIEKLTAKERESA